MRQLDTLRGTLNKQKYTIRFLTFETNKQTNKQTRTYQDFPYDAGGFGDAKDDGKKNVPN